MQLIAAIIRHPVSVSVGVLLVCLFGTIGLLRMPMQLTPEVEIPTITIETRWPGASPQEVEREIVQEQEEQLKSVEGVSKMSSECMDSQGVITLEFPVGINMEEALLRVNSRLQQVQEYPTDADEPVIRTSSSSSQPIAWFILSSRLPSRENIQKFLVDNPAFAAELAPVLSADNLGLAELRLRRAAAQNPKLNVLLPADIDVPTLRKFAEDQIESAFERVDGVSNSNVFGGRDPEMQVVVDPQKLAARQLTISAVQRALVAQNQDTSGGDFWEGKRRWVVRTLSQFRSPEQVEQQVLSVHNGNPVYVRDVAEVRLGYKKPDGFVRRFGSSSIAVNVVRDSGANVLDVMDGLRLANERLNAGLLKDRGLSLTQVYDETDYILSSVGLVQENIIAGGALTVIVLMLFLHLNRRTLLFIPLIAITALAALYLSPWFFALTLAIVAFSGLWFARGSLVVSLAIPVSIIGTFLVMHLLGRSLNVISLAGLAFAVGMLVDNSIVVLENIYRRFQLGESAWIACERATKEVWGAVVASTLTTLAVFIPIVFVQEEAGQLFRDIALAISASVGLSMIVSVTVIPCAASRLLKREDADEFEGAHRSSAVDWIARLGGAFTRRVLAINSWTLASYYRQVAVIVTLTGLSLGLSWLFWPKVEYLPTGNRNLVICIILPPPGYNLDQLMQLGQTVEDELRPYWDCDPGSPAAAKLDFPVIEDFFYVARGRSVFLGLRSADPDRVDELLPLISGGVHPVTGKPVAGLRSKLPGTFVIANKSSLFEQGLTAGRSIDIEITGPDLTKLVAIGGGVFGQVMRELPGSQVQPIPSLDLSSPEVHIVPKLLQSAEMSVSATDLGYSVNALIDGAYASDYYIGGDKIDLSIIGNEKFGRRTQDVEELPIAVPNGQLVSLGALADVTLSSGPEQVNHRERQRAITVRVKPQATVALEDAIQTIREKIVAPLEASGALGNEYTVNLSGTADKLQLTWEALKWNFLLALLITYLLMAALFESWLHPFVIIFSVPLGAVGGILGLRLLSLYLVHGQHQPPQSLDVLTMLGFIILVGTVVNNAILIVHQSLNHMREDSMEVTEAVLESVRNRTRPIFMTTTTTVFGLAPLVLFPGSGSELYRGLGSVVLGGLAVSTIFTLWLIPALFKLMMDLAGFVTTGRKRPDKVSHPTRLQVLEEPTPTVV